MMRPIWGDDRTLILTGRLRSFLALVLVGAHVWLAPFAHADPPDPLWIGGIFDEADYDDVVLLVMAMTSVVATRPVLEVPIQPGVLLAIVPEPTAPPSTPAFTRPIRAPPAA